MSWNDFEYKASEAETPYPRDVEDRYEIRHGKFGLYFHDKRGGGYDMPLEEVLNTLNRYVLRKAQLTWYVGKYGEPKQ